MNTEIKLHCSHYSGVIMGAMASKITTLMIVYSTVYSVADQSEHQSPASLAFVCGEFPVNSPHKWPVTRKCFHLSTSSCWWHGTIVYLIVFSYYWNLRITLARSAVPCTASVLYSVYYGAWVQWRPYTTLHWNNILPEKIPNIHFNQIPTQIIETDIRIMYCRHWTQTIYSHLGQHTYTCHIKFWTNPSFVSIELSSCYVNSSTSPQFYHTLAFFNKNGKSN